MARLIRVIQSLPSDRMSALGVALGVPEAGVTSGELARRIYRVLSDKVGMERTLALMATKDRLVLMMVASSPQGRSTGSRLGAEIPFSSAELSDIVGRLGDFALLQVAPGSEQGVAEIEMPVEIRALLQSRGRSGQGRLADGPKRRPARPASPVPLGPVALGPQETGSISPARRTGDPVQEISGWASRNRSTQVSDSGQQRKPKLARLAETLGLWENGESSERLVEQWVGLTDDDRRTITLRAWLHDSGLVFVGGPVAEFPRRRLVRMALVGMLARGRNFAISGKPQQIDEALRLMGLDWPKSIPAARLRSMVESVADDLEILGLIKPDTGGLYSVASAAAQRISGAALDTGSLARP